MGDDLGNLTAHDHLDADAVCATCGHVNPEGTLMCKTCGNNLRDQRQRRLTAEVQLEDNLKGESRSYIFSGLLTALGLLLVLWAALNVDRITDFLVPGGPSSGMAQIYWTGPDGELYNALAKSLDALDLSRDELAALAQGASESATYVGYFAIFDQPMGPQAEIIGYAMVNPDGSRTVQFVAKLFNGIELRGSAYNQGNSLSALQDTVAVAFDDRHVAARGVALRQSDGGYELYGQSDLSDADFQAYAYYLPIEASMGETGTEANAEAN